MFYICQIGLKCFRVLRTDLHTMAAVYADILNDLRLSSLDTDGFYRAVTQALIAMGAVGVLKIYHIHPHTTQEKPVRSMNGPLIFKSFFFSQLFFFL